eukprot:COSAG06_NODE_8086_length_2276_cov_2.569132_1_plen_252_part_00
MDDATYTANPLETVHESGGEPSSDQQTSRPRQGRPRAKYLTPQEILRGDDTLSRERSATTGDLMIEGRAAGIFGKVDVDANGTISIQEFHAWLTANAPIDKDGAAAMLQEMDVIEKRWAQFDDSDGDGELNLEEFEKVLRQMVTDGIADDAFWAAQTSAVKPPSYDFNGRLGPWLWKNYDDDSTRGGSDDDTWQCRALEYFLRVYPWVFLLWGSEGMRLDDRLGFGCVRPKTLPLPSPPPRPLPRSSLRFS